MSTQENRPRVYSETVGRFKGLTQESLVLQRAKFQQSLDEVNIGAFPLRPNDAENRKLLEHFIEELIGKASTEILNDSIPQKGLYYTSEEPKDAVYMILTIDKEVNEDIEFVMNGQASSIVMGKKGMEEAKDIQAIRYIAPIVPGGHIEGYYKVVKANLKRVDDTAYPIRIKFDVADWTKLEHPAKFGWRELHIMDSARHVTSSLFIAKNKKFTDTFF